MTCFLMFPFLPPLLVLLDWRLVVFALFGSSNFAHATVVATCYLPPSWSNLGPPACPCSMVLGFLSRISTFTSGSRSQSAGVNIWHTSAEDQEIANRRRSLTGEPPVQRAAVLSSGIFLILPDDQYDIE